MLERGLNMPESGERETAASTLKLVASSSSHCCGVLTRGTKRERSVSLQLLSLSPLAFAIKFDSIQDNSWCLCQVDCTGIDMP